MQVQQSPIEQQLDKSTPPIYVISLQCVDKAIRLCYELIVSVIRHRVVSRAFGRHWITVMSTAYSVDQNRYWTRIWITLEHVLQTHTQSRCYQSLLWRYTKYPPSPCRYSQSFTLNNFLALLLSLMTCLSLFGILVFLLNSDWNVDFGTFCAFSSANISMWHGWELKGLIRPWARYVLLFPGRALCTATWVITIRCFLSPFWCAFCSKLRTKSTKKIATFFGHRPWEHPVPLHCAFLPTPPFWCSQKHTDNNRGGGVSKWHHNMIDGWTERRVYHFDVSILAQRHGER